MAFWNSQELENENIRLNQALRAMETENEDLKAQCRILHLQLHDRDSFNGWYAEQHIQFLSMCSKQNDNFYLQHRIHELNRIIQAKDVRIGELETKLQANGRVIDDYKLESMMLQNDCERLSKITNYDTFSTELPSYESTQATYNSSTDYFGFMEEGNYMDLEAEPLIAVHAEPAAAEIEKPGCSYAQHR
ncbi:hypothetical protein AAVH_41032 [Aphelenchoides avenae]|nr:hypothetical protein AAVH_41032 [Aphelenchus avenae]